LFRPARIGELVDNDEDLDRRAWYNLPNSHFFDRTETKSMSATSLSVTATFEDGVLRPEQPLPLAPRQKVTLLLQIPTPSDSRRSTAGEPGESDAFSLGDNALADALELDHPAPVEMPRKRPLALLDPDAAIVTEL
jgi:hypothetical protein